MSSAAMDAALAAVAQYASVQGAATASIAEDLSELAIRVSIADADAALAEAEGLVAAHGARVTLTWELGPGHFEVELRSGSEGWGARDLQPPDALAALRDLQARSTWTTAVLREGADELSRLAGEAVVALPKAEWRRTAEEASGRTVWIGPELVGFARWLSDQPWHEIARFMDRGGLAVLTSDWPTAPQGTTGPLVFAHAGVVPDSPTETSLGSRLEADGRADELGAWRLVQLRVPGPAGARIRQRVNGAAAQAAAWLLADEREDSRTGMARPLRGVDRAYPIASLPPDLDDVSGAAIRRLARWVSDDYGATRLEVARGVAAARVEDAYGPLPEGAVILAAELALRVAVSEKVHAALEQQAEFEKTYLEIDETVGQLRATVAAVVDQAVTRALTSALAVTLAALASERFRGTPTLVIALVTALYLILNCVLLHVSTAGEARERLDEVERRLVVRRAALSSELAEVLSARLSPWRAQVQTRVRWGTAILLALAVTITAAALAAH